MPCASAHDSGTVGSSTAQRAKPAVSGKAYSISEMFADGLGNGAWSSSPLPRLSLPHGPSSRTGTSTRSLLAALGQRAEQRAHHRGGPHPLRVHLGPRRSGAPDPASCTPRCEAAGPSRDARPDPWHRGRRRARQPRSTPPQLLKYEPRLPRRTRRAPDHGGLPAVTGAATAASEQR